MQRERVCGGFHKLHAIALRAPPVDINVNYTATERTPWVEIGHVA
jgi:hypothetical protein